MPFKAPALQSGHPTHGQIEQHPIVQDDGPSELTDGRQHEPMTALVSQLIENAIHLHGIQRRQGPRGAARNLSTFQSILHKHLDLHVSGEMGQKISSVVPYSRSPSGWRGD